jgi:hypothetical protein
MSNQNTYNYALPKDRVGVAAGAETAFNPANPNQYNYDWSGANINQYIQGGDQAQDFSGQNQLDFLRQNNIDVSGLNESSLAFLPSMDKLNTAYERMNTGIGMARTGLGFDLNAQRLAGTNNLMGLTGGQGMASLGGGFGKAGYNMGNAIGSANQQYQSGLNSSMAGFQSNVLNAQYDYQDTQSDYLDNLTSALGNLAASGEDDFTINYTGNTSGTLNPEDQYQNINSNDQLNTDYFYNPYS